MQYYQPHGHRGTNHHVGPTNLGRISNEGSFTLHHIHIGHEQSRPTTTGNGPSPNPPVLTNDPAFPLAPTQTWKLPSWSWRCYFLTSLYISSDDTSAKPLQQETGHVSRLGEEQRSWERRESDMAKPPSESITRELDAPKKSGRLIDAHLRTAKLE